MKKQLALCISLLAIPAPDLRADPILLDWYDSESQKASTTDYNYLAQRVLQSALIVDTALGLALFAQGEISAKEFIRAEFIDAAALYCTAQAGKPSNSMVARFALLIGALRVGYALGFETIQHPHPRLVQSISTIGAGAALYLGMQSLPQTVDLYHEWKQDKKGNNV